MLCVYSVAIVSERIGEYRPKRVDLGSTHGAHRLRQYGSRNLSERRALHIILLSHVPVSRIASRARLADPVAQQSPGRGNGNRYDIGSKESGDVDRSLLIVTHAEGSRIRTPITAALNTNKLWPPVTIAGHENCPGGQDRREGCLDDWTTGRLPCWNVTQSRMVTNGDKIGMG